MHHQGVIWQVQIGSKFPNKQQRINSETSSSAYLNDKRLDSQVNSSEEDVDVNQKQKDYSNFRVTV